MRIVNCLILAITLTSLDAYLFPDYHINHYSNMKYHPKIAEELCKDGVFDPYCPVVSTTTPSPFKRLTKTELLAKNKNLFRLTPEEEAEIGWGQSYNIHSLKFDEDDIESETTQKAKEMKPALRARRAAIN